MSSRNNQELLRMCSKNTKEACDVAGTRIPLTLRLNSVDIQQSHFSKHALNLSTSDPNIISQFLLYAKSTSSAQKA